MRIHALVFAVLLASPGVCNSQVRPRGTQSSAPPAYMQQLKSFDQSGTVTKVVLKNDFTILVAEAHSTPLVQVSTWIKAGSRDDPAGLTGMSAVMAGMLLRGTANRNFATLALDVKAMGGELSSSTSYESTSLKIVAPAPQWKRAVEILADALLNPSFDSTELKRQVEQIRSEAVRRLEDPAELMHARLLATGFAGEQLKRVLPVSADNLSSVTRENLQAFYKSACAPGRVLVLVCGDVTANDVLAAAVNLYAGVKGVPAQMNRPPSGETESGLRYEQVRGDRRLARVLLGFRTASAASDDYPALEVLRAILATGEGSVLNLRLKDQKGIIYHAAADLAGYSDSGYLSLRMDLDPKNFDRCEIAAFTEFEILKRMDPEIGQLERARAQLKREFWEVNQTVSGRGDRLARLECLSSWKSVNSYLARLGQVKWTDVARVARRYLTLENCAVIEYLPAQAEERNVRAETFRGTIQDLLTPAWNQEVEEREKLVVPAVDIPAEPAGFTPAEVRSPFQMASILRGPELFIREDHTMPLLHLGLFFAGGKLAESKANAGITSLLLRSMLRDGKNKSADQIYRQLETYGGALTPVIEDDYFGINLAILSPYVEQGLDLVSEIIKSPKLDPQEIEGQKARQMAALRGRSESQLARRRLLAALFREYSYALDPDGSEESLAGITPEAVQAWYQSCVADKRPMVVIIGDTQGTSLAAYFVRNFSGSRFQDITLPQGFAKSLEKKEVLEDNWQRSYSLIMMGFQAPPEEDDDSFPLLVLQSYAAGLGGRLTGPIEERVRSAFDITVQYSPRMRGGSVTVSLSVAPSDDDQAWKALSEELTRLTTAPVTYRDYRAAVNSAIAQVQLRQQKRSAQIADVIKSVMAGKGLEGFMEYVSRLQEVRQNDLQDAAKRLFNFEKSVAVRMHGRSLP